MSGLHKWFFFFGSPNGEHLLKSIWKRYIYFFVFHWNGGLVATGSHLHLLVDAAVMAVTAIALMQWISNARRKHEKWEKWIWFLQRILEMNAVVSRILILILFDSFWYSGDTPKLSFSFLFKKVLVEIEYIYYSIFRNSKSDFLSRAIFLKL